MILKGTFDQVYPIAPYGYLRSLVIKDENGPHAFQVGFKKIEQEIKGIKKGDQIQIEYTAYDDFTITKL